MLSRIVKTRLETADGKAINPMSAFVRFGFAPHGRESYMAGMHIIGVFLILGLAFIDYEIVDPHVSFERPKPADGDRVAFWTRAHEWVDLLVAFTVGLLFMLSGAKRIDTEYETSYPKLFLFAWNLIVGVWPLAIVNMIFYYHVRRWDASFDPIFEATVTVAFTIVALNTLLGGWPAETADIFLAPILGLLFLVYTAAIARFFDVVMYTQLDWIHDPTHAGANAAVFMVVLFAVSAITTAIACVRNVAYTQGLRAAVRYVASCGKTEGYAPVSVELAVDAERLPLRR